jgi:hypothetical protein
MELVVGSIERNHWLVLKLFGMPVNFDGRRGRDDGEKRQQNSSFTVLTLRRRWRRNSSLICEKQKTEMNNVVMCID